ncbi:hypothetical protein DWB61_04960 [Ancylomarina euxinus]|uniref:Uncharacterized protein n=1 Tax=Ancylomarina euxinus TaxID=2283627 RepID=A0A425Y5M0_9BACT|nr:hypothetical protein [Ancylomarina euxinus]MCZ4694240.1 hypothetical protein [Ancylomarina euxinus]MUP14429.1 hypothetical protein [Ancylomarina euxinus]RRG23735.1 hypothetical protein DWB61_04960 [Ancylomarina euxinus]
MRNYLLLLVVLFSSCSEILKEESLEQKFMKYTGYANKAELCICENQLKQAKLYYDTLFKVDIPTHAREKYNHAICKLKLKDTLTAVREFEDLYQNKYDGMYPYILKYKSKYTARKLSEEDDSLYKESQRIFEIDQKANGNKYNDYENYFNTVKANVQRIKEVVTKLNAIENSNFSINTSKLYIPILHYFQMKVFVNKVADDSTFAIKQPVIACLKNKVLEDLDFEELVRKQVFLGFFDRYTYASLFRTKENDAGNRIAYQFNNYKLVFSPDRLNDSTVALYNRNRKSFFLEDFNDYYKKVEFHDLSFNDGDLFPLFSIKREDSETRHQKESAYNNSENFRIVNSYRLMYGFRNDDDAKNCYDGYINDYFKKIELSN